MPEPLTEGAGPAAAPRRLPAALLGVIFAIGAVTARADEALPDRLYFAMNAPDRPQGDYFRDGDRRPIDVLTYLEVDRGMTALDLMAGTGYYTEMLSAAVGPEGRVYSHNDVMSLRRRHGAIQRAMDRRLAGNRLPNVQIWAKDVDDLELDEQVDVATFMLNMHDLYIFGGEQKVLDALAAVMRALKPGGILGVVDHVGGAGYGDGILHRIDPAIASDLVSRAGFILVGSSDLLANPEDGHMLNVYEPAIRGRTDRFILKAMKPNF